LPKCGCRPCTKAWKSEAGSGGTTIFKLWKPQADKAGLPPGTAIHIGEIKTDRVRISVIDYNQEQVESRVVEEVGECRLLAARRETVTWINVDGLHQVDILEKVGQCFQLHPLTIEDILNTNQRPKLDIFDDYIYLVVRMPWLDQEEGGIGFEQVSFIVSGTQLITFQEREGDTFDAVRTRITKGMGRIRKMGTDYLLYALVDSVVDNYFIQLERIGEEIEDLELELVEKPGPATMQKINYLKREMVMMRKSVWPLREVISGLQREDVPFIGDSIRFFLKDLYDHTIQVIDTVETFRDVISGMLDIYLSSISNRMNEIMKVLTIFAALFIPLTFIAGLYGMNFNPAASPFNMPELSWYYGYPMALGMMVAVAVGMLYFFKRKGWF
jgi:magnesium transporter